MTDLQRAIKWLEETESYNRLWSGIFHQDPEQSEELAETANHCRVLLDTLRWVPVSERLPESGDSDEKGYVMTLDTSDVAETFEAAEIENWNKTHDRKITHWMRLPPKPEGRG